MNELTQGAHTLRARYAGIEIDDRGRLSGASKFVFVRLDYDADIEAPNTLAHVRHDEAIYFLIPKDVELSKPLAAVAIQRLERATTDEGQYFLPESTCDWASDLDITSEQINGTLRDYKWAVYSAQQGREAKALLERDDRSLATLYASRRRVEDKTPMLVEGWMTEAGVSVYFGPMDEFKTTLILDMAAHIAAGASWQGRAVKPRPVVWYALEGADGVPVRLRALEARLRTKETAWGNFPLPIAARDRIPAAEKEWRAQLEEIGSSFNDDITARDTLEQLPQGKIDRPRYPDVGPYETLPLVVIDTYSMALGEDDEKGAKAVGFIQRCLNLLKTCPEFAAGEDEDGEDLSLPVASHVIIIHHPTKSGNEIAGHRAITANTSGLYRVRRYGKIGDMNRPLAGEVIPERLKDNPLPAPMRFEVEVVQVDGTKRTAAVLKERAAEVPTDLVPIVEALSEFDDGAEITQSELNNCLDVVAAADGKDGAAKRQARKRCRGKLEAVGVLEAIEGDGGRYLLHLGIAA